MVDALLEEARKLVEEGAEARLAAADDAEGASAAAEAIMLAAQQGDANDAAGRRQAVADIASSATD